MPISHEIVGKSITQWEYNSTIDALVSDNCSSRLERQLLLELDNKKNRPRSQYENQ